MTARRYWMTMTYRCDRCGLQMTFYLEDGCEGPRDGGTEATTIPYGPMKGNEVDWEKTDSGRLVVPVPFVAAGCPSCQPQKPWRLGKGSGCLEHVDWRRDQRFPLAMVEEVPPGCGRFEYPPDPRAENACGIPILGGT